MWSTPSSTARRRTASAASRSRGGPNTPGPASCIAPNPIRRTSWSPSLAVSVVWGMPRGCATVGRVTRRASIVGLAPPPSQERRSELTDFLRNRRAQVTPQDVGLPANGRRRTPGLRREEVAQLAGVGLSWYTWLEQGRDIKPSAGVLDALARVLRLDTAERAHLFHLARVELPLPATAYTRAAPPGLAEIVTALEPNPAYLIGPRTDVLAWNAGAIAMLGEPSRAPDGRQHLLWWPFTRAGLETERGDSRAPRARPHPPRPLPPRARPPHRRPGLRRPHRGARGAQPAVPRVVAAPRGARRAARHEDRRAPARWPPGPPSLAVGADEPSRPAPHPVRARRRGDAGGAGPARRLKRLRRKWRR